MKKIFIILISIFAISYTVSAQEPMRTAYFLDGYNFRHQMNPAMPAARSYFNIPALGYINTSVQSCMGINTFLFPDGQGNLNTFMSSAVSTDTFLKGLKKNNGVELNLATSLFSLGIWGKKGGFTTVDLNFKTNINASLPKDLFAFVKSPSNSTYDISNIAASARAYMEVALGRTQKINDDITVGAKLKFLMGLASIDMNIKSMNLSLSRDVWSVNANAEFKASSLFSCPTYAESGVANPHPNALNLDSFGIVNPLEAFMEKGVGAFLGGVGFGLDLGATWEVLDGLTVSASLLDLGFIRWKESTKAVASDKSWEFKGFEDISFDSESDNAINKQLETLGKKASEMIVLEKVGNNAYSEMLAATVHIGAEYVMPFWEGMSVGALSTTRIKGASTWSEGRVSLNIAVGNWLALSGSYALSNFGSNFGAALNLHAKAFSLYVGTDSFVTHFTPKIEELGMPLPYKKLNLALNLGLQFNISKRHDKK